MEGCRHPCHGYLAQRLCAADTCKWKCLSLSWFVLGCWRFHGRCHPSGYAAFPGYPAWPGSLNLKHQGASHLVLRSVSWCLFCPIKQRGDLAGRIFSLQGPEDSFWDKAWLLPTPPTTPPPSFRKILFGFFVHNYESKNRTYNAED